MKIVKTIGNRFLRLALKQDSIPEPSKLSISGLKNPGVVFFIVGHPKSGTTWLSEILNGHPQICCRREGHFFFRDDGYNTLANALSSSEHLRQWASRDFNHWSKDFDSELLYFNKLLVQFYLQREAERTGKPIIGDKSPSYQLTEMAELFPEAKAIHMVRDGRDVAVSMAFHRSKETDRYMSKDVMKELDSKIGQITPASSLRNLPDRFIATVANTWQQEVRTCGRQGKKLFGESYLEIRYEDLHEAPEPVIRKVLAFLQAEASNNIVRSCLHKTQFEAMSGGRKSGEEDVKSFFRKGIVGDWKNVFSERNISQFGAIAGDLLKQLGYES
jgi:hypothetical protein